MVVQVCVIWSYTLLRLILFSRTHKQTDMLPLLITIKRFEWVFYMPYTVRAESSDVMDITITPNRPRSVLRTAGFYPVLDCEALVFSLLVFIGDCGHQCNFRNGGIPFQNARRWVPLSVHWMPPTFGYRVLVGDRSTPRRSRGQRTWCISSNVRPACRAFNGILHSNLCWVRFEQIFPDSC